MQSSQAQSVLHRKVDIGPLQVQTTCFALSDCAYFALDRQLMTRVVEIFNFPRIHYFLAIST